MCGVPSWVADLFCFGTLSASTDRVFRRTRAAARVPTALLPPTVTRVDVPYEGS